jgi:hypothetical protein
VPSKTAILVALKRLEISIINEPNRDQTTSETYGGAAELALALLEVRNELGMDSEFKTYACHTRSSLFGSSGRTSLYPFNDISHVRSTNIRSATNRILEIFSLVRYNS